LTKKVFALDTQPGIQRDGTILDKNYYNDGRWVRFQRKRPRKILGYREITATLAGPSRGIYVNPENAFNYIYNGYSDGLQEIPIDNNGLGSGVIDFTLNDFTPNVNNLWQFDALFDAGGTGQEFLLAHPGQNLTDIDNITNTPVLGGNTSGTTLSAIGVFTAAGSTNSTSTITLSVANALVGAGQLVTDSAGDIPPGTTVVSVSSTTVVLSAAATGTTASNTFTFDNQINVSGGVVVLHPYIFVYGNYGFIKNNAAGNASDWVSADSNETNVASTKIVKGLPVRGGSNSPSGLFWSLDSLIRVSYAPTTVTTGVTASTFYWRYDVISSQTSILSSSSVIEYDGIYYWCGVDRFMLYNGVVKEIPNDFNQNYFFDNLNYAQRQKVYATKVSRYGEIWWFYPRGDSTECNDVIIYNVREGVWYDAGQAEGARRSAGFFSQVFPYPINADWTPNATGALNLFTINDPGSGYTDGVYPLTALTGGSGTGASATITVVGGVVTDVVIDTRGLGYEVDDFLSAVLPVGSDFEIRVDSVITYVSLYQHEIGVDKVFGGGSTAIESYFETNNLGWITGGPSQQALFGDNYWLRLERVEPDFIQAGNIDLYVTGKPFAQSEDYTAGPYVFTPDTGKVDMREQRREPRLKFVSNVVGGNYQLGVVLLSADLGDVRPY
jgi:hypothetical protein